VCPAKGTLQMSMPTRVGSPVDEARPAPALPAWALAVGIAALFLGIFGYAKTAGMWQTNLPRTVYIELVPQADQASHPMPGDPALNQ